jgi:hypothetical protein
MNVPVLPALSRHVPCRVEIEIVASTCTGAPLGAVTMVRPNPIDPSGFWKARPTTLACTGAPH